MELPCVFLLVVFYSATSFQVSLDNCCRWYSSARKPTDLRSRTNLDNCCDLLRFEVYAVVKPIWTTAAICSDSQSGQSLLRFAPIRSLYYVFIFIFICSDLKSTLQSISRKTVGSSSSTSTEDNCELPSNIVHI